MAPRPPPHASSFRCRKHLPLVPPKRTGGNGRDEAVGEFHGGPPNLYRSLTRQPPIRFVRLKFYALAATDRTPPQPRAFLSKKAGSRPTLARGFAEDTRMATLDAEAAPLTST